MKAVFAIVALCIAVATASQAQSGELGCTCRPARALVVCECAFMICTARVGSNGRGR